MFPLPSMASSLVTAVVGSSNPFVPEIAMPLALNSLIEWLPSFATHTFPALSTAMYCGELSPPPVYPLELDCATPLELNLLMELLPLLAVHTLPEPSMAMPYD
jgi:hypothetical protein